MARVAARAADAGSDGLIQVDRTACADTTAVLSVSRATFCLGEACENEVGKSLNYSKRELSYSHSEV